MHRKNFNHKKIKTMKTLVVIFIFSLSLVGFAQANTNDVLSDIIKNEIKYPDYAKEQKIEGVVLVSFFVDGGGLIHIEESNASNDFLRDYVLSRLKNLVINRQDSTYQERHMKFIFQIG